MKISRRSILGGLLALIPGIYVFKKGVLSPDTGFNFDRIFSALIDTFVPADKWPGAIDLNIDKQILESVNANSDYRTKVSQAAELLHLSAIRIYHQGFDLLPLPKRTKLVNKMLNSGDDEYARIQFINLRLKTITKYYTSEAAFQMLDYHPPSQGGYPDYDKPPV